MLYQMQSKQINFINLLKPERLDIVVKYLYAKAVLENSITPKIDNMYKKHIAYRTGGVENHKQSIQNYIADFKLLIKSLQSSDFDHNKPIPVSKETGIVLDGAHRAAVCIALQINPTINHISNKAGLTWDYQWFKKHRFTVDELNTILNSYIKLKPLNTTIIILWGPAKNYWEDINNMIQDKMSVIASQDLTFTPEGLTKFIYNIYKFETGPVPSDVIKQKNLLLQQYEPTIRFIVAEFDNPEYIIRQERKTTKQPIELKEQIRQTFAKHIPDNQYITLHTADSPEQVKHVANIILNQDKINPWLKNPDKIELFRSPILLDRMRFQLQINLLKIKIQFIRTMVKIIPNRYRKIVKHFCQKIRLI